MREVWTKDGATRLFAVEAGEGPTLVFLHGGLTDHRAVLPLVHPLADRYRVVTPDLRASGRSWCAGPLTFDRLSADLALLLDELGVEAACVGGVSSGSGPAVHFAINHPDRTFGLVAVQPPYAGTDVGYTKEQAEAFGGMDAVAGRATDEGVEVLRDLYFSRLPGARAQRAWEIASDFDAGSVSATSRFIASGVQPFEAARDLEAIRVPTLLVPGDDPVHPAAVADLYAASIPGIRTTVARGPGITRAIREFLGDSVAR
jgi:pimeloyl-ACP methyl ester carboxylesterase